MSSLLFETTKLKPSQTYSESSDSNQPDRTTIRSCLIVAATGLGKTVIMGGLANHWPKKRVMMISHRFELNQQAIKQFEHICGEMVDLEQAAYRADQKANPSRIVVASVQTLNSQRRGKYRMERFDPNEFGLLLIDEAHRAAAATYRRVIEYFQQNQDLRTVGVTATPDRLDGVGLGCVFEEVAADLNIHWGIDNGWLVAPRQMFVAVEGLDLSEVRTVGGDLDSRQLAQIVELEKNLHAMAKPIVDVCGKEKQSIVFAASVRQAHRLAELIRDYHEREFGSHNGEQTAIALDGSLSPQDPKRREIVKDFKSGKIQMLVNMGVATEGFDAPGVDVIAIGRPTKSRALYTQMLGRGLRPIAEVVTDEFAHDRCYAIFESKKPYCTVLDFVGQSGRHKLVSASDILYGENEPSDVVDRANSLASNPEWSGSSLDAIREAREQIALEREAARKKVTMGVDYELRESGDSYAKVRKTEYTGGASEKQVKMLLRLGVTQATIDKQSKRSASVLIDRMIKTSNTSFAQWLRSQKTKSP